MSDLSIKSTKMREVGLSTDKAMEQFAGIVKSALFSVSWRQCRDKNGMNFFLSSIIQAFMLFCIVMLIYHDAIETVNRLGLVLRLFLIITLGLWELYMNLSQTQRLQLYFASKVQELLGRTMKAWRERSFSYGMPTRIPILPKHGFVKVYRDGKLRICPTSLIVAGDIIQLLQGEPEPCRLERLSSDNLECIILESPIVKVVEGYLDSINSDGNVDKQHKLDIYKLALNGFIVVYSVCYCFKLVVNLYDVLVFIIMLRSNIFTAIIEAWGSTRMQLVADVLKKSKTPYDEAMGVDEFDEDAPPPSKDARIRIMDVFARITHNFRHYNWNEFLYQPDLVELINNMSVMCFTDREGPISLALPMPEEITCFEHIDKLSTIEVDECVKSQQSGHNRLKPFGLATICCSQCKNSVATTSHRRFIHTEEYRHFLHSPALQACQCAVGRAMGDIDLFHSTRLVFISEYWIKPDSNHGPLVIFAYSDKESSIVRCFCVGALLAVLECCTEYYVDGEIRDMTQDIKRTVVETEEGAVGRDEECIGYAFQTLFVDSLSAEAVDCLHENVPNDELEEEFRELCFLGSLTCSPKPREDMQEFIDDIMNSGVRFVYLGEEGERQAKTFGSRLGLETDWNGCILLSSKGDANYSDLSDIKTKLPVGVSQIREHLKYVDDIPLHVSVFAESTPQATAEMVKIYQENDESVCVVMSSLNPSHFQAANQADLCISMEPLTTATTNSAKPLWEVAGEWHSLSASLSLPFESSPYVLTDLMKEARTLHRSRTSSLTFFKCASLMLIWTDANRLYSILIMCLLSVSINAAALYDSDILKQMPTKQQAYISRSDMRDLSLGWIVAYVLSAMNPSCVPLAMLVMSIGHLHPIKSILVLFPEYFYCEKKWIFLALLGAWISFIIYNPIPSISVLPCLLFHEIGKYFYRLRFMESQKRSKLEFSTRLGMHSPI